MSESLLSACRRTAIATASRKSWVFSQTLIDAHGVTNAEALEVLCDLEAEGMLRGDSSRIECFDWVGWGTVEPVNRLYAVRPLEWSAYMSGWSAETPFGRYEIEEGDNGSQCVWFWSNERYERHEAESMQAAKDWCSNHHVGLLLEELLVDLEAGE